MRSGKQAIYPICPCLIKVDKRSQHLWPLLGNCLCFPRVPLLGLVEMEDKGHTLPFWGLCIETSSICVAFCGII